MIIKEIEKVKNDTVAASSGCPIKVKTPKVNREKRVGVVAQKNTHHASKYFLVYKRSVIVIVETL